LALSKAARSFTLYDPGNALVRQFLAEYQARAGEATAFGAVVLEVQPFELLRQGEAVYREEDRERSLAFKLFRDGVRRLTFQPQAPWEELLRFLEIMAVRSTGIRQQEEDLVSMLRKAEFRSIAFAAVEGFTPEEDNPEANQKRRRAGQGAGPPATFDTPFPLLPQPGPIAHRPVPEAALAPLRAEEGAPALAPQALRLAGLLLAEAGRGTVPAAEAQQFLVEVRDFLIADGALDGLAALADLVMRQPAGPLRREILQALGDRRVLSAVLDAVPPGGAELPAEAARLVPLVPSEVALDLLVSEPDEGRRRLLVGMAAARLPADAEAVVARLPSLEPSAAHGLLEAIATRAPDRLAAAAVALLEHPAAALQVKALGVLEATEGTDLPADRLLGLLRSEQEPVRIGAVAVLARSSQAAVFTALAEALTSRRDVSRAEADALGRALARINPGRASGLFDEWLKPRRGLLGKLTGGGQEEVRQWAAVAGLGAHPSPEAAARIEAAAQGADEALRRHCFATLARRRHEGARRG
jgi:hypothetical protein